MKIQLYAIFDTAAGIYQKPFFGQSDGEVKRSFMDVATADDTPIGRHPEDFSLYRLGNFDDNTGVVKNEENECLATAHEIIAQSRQTNLPNMEGPPEVGLNSSKFPADYKPGLTD